MDGQVEHTPPTLEDVTLAGKKHLCGVWERPKGPTTQREQRHNGLHTPSPHTHTQTHTHTHTHHQVCWKTHNAHTRRVVVKTTQWLPLILARCHPHTRQVAALLTQWPTLTSTQQHTNNNHTAGVAHGISLFFTITCAQ